MYTSMWFMSVVAILMIDVRTGALLQKDTEPRQCYQCPHNQSACQPERRLQAPCPARGLHCATVAKAPDFTSTLTCSASAAYPCTLSRSQHITQLTCTCAGHFCNSLFTARLRNKLLNITTDISNANKTSLDLTDMFLKSFGNVSLNKLYEIVTVKTNQEKRNNSQLPVHITSTFEPNIGSLNNLNAPRAEALKHEATEPSDDEEDENEGSGSYDETRLRRPAAAPAAPSSFLPASENEAPPLLINSFLVTTMLFIMM